MLKGNGLLSEGQKAFLRFFAELPDQEQFYLTGGTALAEFYLAHRYSYDLDLFTTEEGLLTPFCQLLERRARRKRLDLRVVRRFTTFTEYTMQVGEESVRIQMAIDSPFRFNSPVPTEYGVQVNDWDDLKVDKLLAFYGRAEPRDAVDLYFILEREPLEPLMALASRKDPGFDRYWFAAACQRVQTFSDDLSDWPVQMLITVSPVLIKQRFEEIAVTLMRHISPQQGHG